MARRTIKSVLAAVLLCLVMLPVTALAAAPNGQAIYVGNVNVASGGYWTTDSEGKVTSAGATQPSDNYIHYDAGNNTLTLHNATIKESVSTDTSTLIAGPAIGVVNSSGAAELTIQLEGDNTIEDVSTGIYVLAHSPSTGDASLTITGSGSLDASGSYNPGIRVQSNTGNGTLTITGAKVTASSSNGGNGVQIRCGEGSDASLTVNDGSLTATGSGNYSAGINLQFGSGDSGSGTPTVIVSENAIVKASSSNGGGIASNSGSVTPSGTGIVFNGNEGTVYGDVTLQTDLEIGEDESLKLDDGASLNAGGHNVIVDGGTVDESLETSLGGSVKYAPSITTTNLPNGTVGTSYSQALAADGDATITWSSSDLPEWLTLDSVTGVISGTPTAAGTSTFTVKAESSFGSDSKKLSITINEPAAISVTGVSLGQSTLTLAEGGTAQLTATVEPANATNKDVTWSSDDEAVATVDASGKVTAVASGTATITVTTEDGSLTDTCTVTVTAKTYGISASPTKLNFGSVYVGYAQPAAQTVTVTNTGNQTVTLTQPVSASYEIGTLSATELKPNDTASFTVRPKPGLGVGTYSETLSVSGTNGVSATVALSFSVSSRPYIPPAPSGPDWDDATDDIAAADPGDRVVVDMDGETELPGEVLEELAGRDVTLVLEMEDGVAWEIHGGDVPEGTSFSDVDLGAEPGTSDIPASVVNLVTGEAGSTQVTLAHEGPFGFALTLVAPVGEKNAGLVANMYRYDEAADALRYEAAGLVDEDGLARVQIDHASSWLIALDDRLHALPFLDADEGEWYSEAVRWAWLSGTMTGYGDGSGLFGTEDVLTRAQMAAVLFNAAGQPEVSAAGLPSDCDPSAWYAAPVAWALQEGVFHGYGDGSAFGPDDPLTREQAACVLHNAAGNPGAAADLSSFSDAGEASDWAREALSWAVAEGVINGVDVEGGGRELQPGRACTRTEMAALMMNLAARS